MNIAPYANLPPSQWLWTTKKLVKKHPLKTSEIVDVVLACWTSIFDSRFGTAGFCIGKDIFPKPQIMGFLLHELIPLELQARHPGEWRGDKTSEEKDIVCIANNMFSIEVKTSSNPSHIYGNRSYTQKTSKGKKAKTGYYLAVNFEKFIRNGKNLPRVRLVRFGWLDSADWRGQTAPTGQQSRLPAEVENGKLVELYCIT